MSTPNTVYHICAFWDTYCHIDYAAWWQSFGSIAAILFAGWIARSNENRSINNNIKITRIVIDSWVDALAEIETLCSQPSPDGFEWEIKRSKFGVMLHQSQQIDFRYLPYEVTKNVSIIRELIASANKHFVEPESNTFQIWFTRDVFNLYSEKSERPILEIYKNLKEIKWWQFYK